MSSLWRIVEPAETRFARCLGRSPPRLVTRGACDFCGRGAVYEQSYPLVIEWEPGSVVVGDFSWPTGDRTAVVESVLARLLARFPGLRQGPVEMVEDPALKRRKRAQEARIRLPYEGPALGELIVESVVKALRVTWAVVDTCEKCGEPVTEVRGVERDEHRWDAAAGVLRPVRTPREPEEGIFVSKTDAPFGIFRVDVFPNGLFCTSETREALESMDLSNLRFLEYGDVLRGVSHGV